MIKPKKNTKDDIKKPFAPLNVKQIKFSEDQIKAANWVHYLLVVLLIVLVSFSIVSIVWPNLFWHQFEFTDYPLHSTIEALGAIAAILMAFLPLQVLFGKYRPSYVFLSVGFLVMGFWDLFHSAYLIGDGFVFSHSMALLSGGFLFALFVFPWKFDPATTKKSMFWIAGLLSLISAVLVAINRNLFPAMVMDGQFTPIANTMNLMAGILFLISAVKLIAIYIRDKTLGILILVFVAVSSGVVGISFQYSMAWSDNWWLWHIIRVLAFLAILGYMYWRVSIVNAERNKAMEEIKKQHIQLAESDKRFSLVNEATGHGLWDWNLITNEVYFSPVWKKQLGYAEDELENTFQNWVSLLHPDDRERSMELVNAYVQNPEKKFIIEFRLRHKKGHYVWIHNEAASEKDEAGKVNRMFGAHTDITGQKEAEEHIKQSEKKFKGLFESDPSAIFIADPITGLVNDVNPAAERLMEMSRSELIGLHQSKLHPEDIMQEQVEKFKKLQGQPNVSVDSEVLAKSGKRKPVEIKVSMVEIEGKPHILGIFHDISKLLEGQQKLKQSEEKHRSIFESATDAFIIASMEGKIVEVNPSACKMYGYAYDEMIGKTATELIHPEYHYKFSDFIKDIQDKGFYEGETVDVRKNQTTFFTEFHGSLINFNNQKHMLVVIRDVSEKKQQENELILKNIVYELSVAANSTADLAGNLTSVNQSFLDTWGYTSKDEVLGKPIPIFIKYENEAGKILAGLTAEGKWQGTYTALKKDGSTFVAQANASVLYNSDGEKIGYQSSVFDVSEAIEAEKEKEKVQEQLKISMKNLQHSNKELERFAYVASHDLQEPLRMVASYTQLLERRYKGQLDERADKYIYYAVDGAMRMQNLINDLLDFSRISTRGEKFTTTDVSEVLKNTINSLSIRIKETGAQIKTGKMPVINADSGQIERLFLNLISNALKFIKPDEQPLIEIEAESQNGFWLFQVKDNGIGIDKKFSEKVFVIFQRLHGANQYKGTGIGLAICKRIVQRHEGKIWFESEENNGTTFYFTLKMQKLNSE